MKEGVYSLNGDSGGSCGAGLPDDGQTVASQHANRYGNRICGFLCQRINIPRVEHGGHHRLGLEDISILVVPCEETLVEPGGVVSSLEVDGRLRIPSRTNGIPRASHRRAHRMGEEASHSNKVRKAPALRDGEGACGHVIHNVRRLVPSLTSEKRTSHSRWTNDHLCGERAAIRARHGVTRITPMASTNTHQYC
jgi:hypothetical protein